MSNDEIHGGCLTTDDVDRIQNMINDFCLKSLLPHMERQMKLFHEAVIIDIFFISDSENCYYHSSNSIYNNIGGIS